MHLWKKFERYTFIYSFQFSVWHWQMIFHSCSCLRFTEMLSLWNMSRRQIDKKHKFDFRAHIDKMNISSKCWLVRFIRYQHWRPLSYNNFEYQQFKFNIYQSEFIELWAIEMGHLIIIHESCKRSKEEILYYQQDGTKHSMIKM